MLSPVAPEILGRLGGSTIGLIVNGIFPRTIKCDDHALGSIGESVEEWSGIDVVLSCGFLFGG
jgi:hypothetical protein